MKFATDKSHRDYFYKNGVIEFDGLVNMNEVYEMSDAIDRILSHKLSVKLDQLDKQNPNDIFFQGRDLFRQSELLKRLILHRRLAEIAVELMEVRLLRIGYDQLLEGEPKPPIIPSAYDQFLLQEGTLQEKSCMTPVICGLMLCLEPATSQENPSPLFPKTAGAGTFFKPDKPLDLKYLIHAPGSRYLMITYADPRTVYILNEKDPHTHNLKHLGYVFGDKLSDKLNPFLNR